jgi:hypothetical protein
MAESMQRGGEGEVEILSKTPAATETGVKMDKNSSRFNTFFYQQKAEDFLKQPRPNQIGGLLGYISRMVGGKFSEEPDNMLYEPEKDTTDSSLLEESSLRCRLSEDTQRVSSHRHTPYCRSIECL